jgi:hypothetical protein
MSVTQTLTGQGHWNDWTRKGWSAIGTRISPASTPDSSKRRAKLWDLFLKYKGSEEAEDAFEKDFQQRFARAYADEISRFKAAMRQRRASRGWLISP